VVDAGADVVDLLEGHADVAREFARGALHAVAQPHRADLGGAVDRPTVHRHRVDVLQERHVGADLLHIAAHVEQHWDGAQAAEDAADAERVGDGLAQAVLLGDLEIDDGGGLVAAHLDHTDRIIGAIECAAAVGGGFDGRVPVDGLGDFIGDDLRGLQTLWIDIEQADGAIGQFREAENIIEQVTSEYGAPCADKCDFCHDVFDPFMKIVVASGPALRAFR